MVHPSLGMTLQYMKRKPRSTIKYTVLSNGCIIKKRFGCSCCCLKREVQSSSLCLLLIFKKDTMQGALHYKRHSSRLPAKQWQVRIPLRYFSEEYLKKSPLTTEYSYCVELLWIDKLLFDSFWAGSKNVFIAADERNFPGKCPVCYPRACWLETNWLDQVCFFFTLHRQTT